jgi:hypothetical protein
MIVKGWNEFCVWRIAVFGESGGFSSLFSLLRC